MSLIHLHKRKKNSKKLESYPHTVKWKRNLDKLIYFFGFISPAFTIFQIYKIFISKNANGLSLITWIVYFLSSSIFLLYAFAHKEKTLIRIYSAGVLVNLLVVIEILIF